MTRLATCSLLLTSIFASHLLTGGVSAQQHQKLRKNTQHSHNRQESVIRRMYGPENAQVRKYRREVEDRPERSRTGLLGDPNHKVPYENHPYDKTNRHLQAQSSDLFKPMRIRFETKALDDTRTTSTAAKIDFIKNEILPKTATFWSQALSVVPVTGNLKISSLELDGNRYCGDSEFTEVPAEHISTGLFGTDLVLYVSGTPSSRFCGGTTLAVAVACNFDQYDRPTAGAINICLDSITVDADGTASDAVVRDNVDVLIHEVAHVLGLSSNSFPYFWDPETAEPRTPRNWQEKQVECVDGVTRTVRKFPAENTMQFFTAENGQRYAAIVTPKVKAVARNQFDCQTLPGAKLENQPTGDDSCTGDHWDEHDYYPEAMTGVISPTTNVLSHLTLALFEDSGWYKANYTMGEANPWGLGAGCDFVNKPCLTANNVLKTTEIPDYAKGYFCKEESKPGCSPALTHKMACTVLDYFFIEPRILPEEYFQYFPDDPTKGGPRQADYCPVYGSTYQGSNAEGLACGDPKNAPKTVNTYSEKYGEDSMCIESLPDEISGFTAGDGKCYRTACIKDEMALKIEVRGKWYTCDYDFQVLTVTVGAGLIPLEIICPRLTTACPDLFCPFSCAGRGECNYANIENGTVVPKCECFDPEDTSPGCSDSLLPDGDYLNDASDLFDNIEINFFDSLVAIFVDHPDKWTTASWTWAGGLLTVFLIMLLCICSTFWPSRKET